MNSSSLLIVLLLLLCISYPVASQIIQGIKGDEGKLTEFNVLIKERGTRFSEKITIDEINNVEYFHVPAHNRLTEADYLYDFQSKMSVSRVKSDAKCYIGPLPDNLPKPANLRAGLQTAAQFPPSQIVIARKYWAVTEQVDKTFLPQKFQDFCGQFSVFRLQEVDLKSNTGLRNTAFGSTRLARNVDIKKLPFCSKGSLPDMGECNPQDWMFSYEIRDEKCTWWLTNPDCKLDKGSKQVCPKWKHLYNSMICYVVRCP